MKDSLLQLQRSALEYLDQTGAFQTIAHQCTQYEASQGKAFHFTIPVEPRDLLDLDAQLGNLLLNQPMRASFIFQQVVFVALKCLNLLPRCDNIGQVVIIFQVRSLPSFPEYKIQSTEDLLTRAQTKSFIHYDGIIIGKSTVHKYTRSAHFQCTEESCPGSTDNRYIRLHIPGALEAQTIRKDFQCTVCGQPLKEDVSSRHLGVYMPTDLSYLCDSCSWNLLRKMGAEDKLIIQLVPDSAFTSQTGMRHQAITTHLRDELVHGVEIGDHCHIIGWLVHDAQQRIATFEANNIIKQEVPRLVQDLTLPEDIQQLYQDRKASPWSFGLSLAYAFGGSITPCGTYLHLKLGMLLSLVGQPEEKKRGLDLLAIGQDTSELNRLLLYGASLAKKNVIHSTGMSLTACLNQDLSRNGAAYIEGGSLLLAKNGVCFLPDLHCHKKSQRQDLLQVLERNCVVVSVPGKLSATTVNQLFLPLACKVWGVAECVGSTAMDEGHLEDLNQPQVQLSNNSKNITDVFSMVYFGNIEPETYAEYMDVHQHLFQAMGMRTMSLISDQHFKQFLEFAQSRSLSLSADAEYLIRGYYVASRRVRSSTIQGRLLPQSALSTITSLAYAHAKLNLHENVTAEDAVMAIYLYEESFICKYGTTSVIGVQPLQHIKDNNIQSYIGQERDLRMKMIHHQLINFIKRYVDDDAFSFTEE